MTGSSPFLALYFPALSSVGVVVGFCITVVWWLDDALPFVGSLVVAVVVVGRMFGTLELVNLLIRTSYGIRCPFWPAFGKLDAVVAFPIACGLSSNSACSIVMLLYVVCNDANVIFTPYRPSMDAVRRSTSDSGIGLHTFGRSEYIAIVGLLAIYPNVHFFVLPESGEGSSEAADLAV